MNNYLNVLSFSLICLQNKRVLEKIWCFDKSNESSQRNKNVNTILKYISEILVERLQIHYCVDKVRFSLYVCIFKQSTDTHYTPFIRYYLVLLFVFITHCANVRFPAENNYYNMYYKSKMFNIKLILLTLVYSGAAWPYVVHLRCNIFMIICLSLKLMMKKKK